jgi:hypothetical protein
MENHELIYVKGIKEKYHKLFVVLFERYNSLGHDKFLR